MEGRGEWVEGEGWRERGGVERGGEEGVKVGGEMEGELKGVGRRE